MHGPKSVLCTQARPTPCNQCDPTPSKIRRLNSNDSFDNVSFDTDAQTVTSTPDKASPIGRRSHDPSSKDISRTSTAVDSVLPTPSIESSPYFVNVEKQDHQARQNRFSPSQGDTCASCTFTVPDEIAKQLPAGAPGSPKSTGPGSNGSPVLRTRQMAPSCTLDQAQSCTFDGPPGRQCSHVTESGSSATVSSSFQSNATSSSSETSCHLHEINYLTVRSPQDPTEYALLRAAVIRTLSSEMLPRGLSSGPIVVGDSTNGYTIAHVFRVPDPKARGRRRSYAFVALAGQDGQRALRAFPIISAAFHRLAEKLVQAAERHQEEQRLREQKAEEAESHNRKYTPVSSFLTQRVVDVNGMPRRVGQTLPRSLADITGNSRIFAEIHAEFCLTLFVLGKRLKVLPRSNSLTCETLVKSDEGQDHTLRSQVSQQSTNGLGLRTSSPDIMKLKKPDTPPPSPDRAEDMDKLRTNDTTPKPTIPKANVEVALARMSLKSSSDSKSIPSPSTTSPNTAHRKEVVV